MCGSKKNREVVQGLKVWLGFFGHVLATHQNLVSHPANGHVGGFQDHILLVVIKENSKYLVSIILSPFSHMLLQHCNIYKKILCQHIHVTYIEISLDSLLILSVSEEII